MGAVKQNSKQTSSASSSLPPKTASKQPSPAPPPPPPAAAQQEAQSVRGTETESMDTQPATGDPPSAVTVAAVDGSVCAGQSGPSDGGGGEGEGRDEEVSGGGGEVEGGQEGQAVSTADSRTENSY